MIFVRRAVTVTLLLIGCGTPELGQSIREINPTDLCADAVPAVLDVPAGQQLKAAYAADGVQIYLCSPTASGAYAWTFRAPRASLLDPQGKVVGTHFAGPTWQFQDGSSVRAARVAGATVDATAIPWLLLRAVANTDSPDGDGRFADITYVQRLSTTGGLAPSGGCDAAHVGAEADVPYAADYFFYHAGGNGSRQCR